MDYKNSKIYKIVDNSYTKMYIGSTTSQLSKRFYEHKNVYKSYKNGKHHKYTLFDIFDEFGVNNCKIELIENYPCNSKNELEKKEGEHIKNNDCVNRIIVGQTREEYLNANAEKIKQQMKEYREKNKDRQKQLYKIWYEKNKDKQKEKMKEYSKKYYTEIRKVSQIIP